MAVDREALRNIAEGDPEAKIAVRRRWLAAVLSELEELDRLRGQKKIGDRIDDMVERLTGKRAA